MLVTGTTKNSRLIELKKYAVNVSFSQQYISGGTTNIDGVDFTNSTSGVSVTYYIGGIKYIDDIVSGVTTVISTAAGTSSPDFIDVPMYMSPNKENIISNPKISDDVFITRQEISAFERNYKLEYIKNLVDLTTYAGGKYFNILNNT